MLSEYEFAGKETESIKKKAKNFWKKLTPKEKEGLRRMGAVGIGGAGIALAYDPEALPVAFLPASTYINRGRIQKVYKKIKEVV